jgi:hypothetical protein
MAPPLNELKIQAHRRQARDETALRNVQLPTPKNSPGRQFGCELPMEENEEVVRSS